MMLKFYIYILFLSYGISFLFHGKFKGVNLKRHFTKIFSSDIKASKAPLIIKEVDEDEDPLRSQSELKTYSVKSDYYKFWYIALGNTDNQKMVDARQDAWFHHCQWLRRSSLVPDLPTAVKFEFTRLSDDCMNPSGQVLGLRSNASNIVESYLEQEPLGVNGGVKPWELYKADMIASEKARNDYYDPYIFVGVFDKKGAKKADQDAQFRFHLDSKRVCMYAVLRPMDEVARPPKTPLYDDGFGDEPLDNTDLDDMYSFDGAEEGVCIVFNSKSNAEALKYISEDPVYGKKLYKKTFLSSINIQDVDGLHQAMPRTFAEKAQLQQVHFLDPEDLLRAEAAFLERLPNEEYRSQNEQALDALQAVGLDYRYARISMEESYFAKEDLKNWNTDMALWQKLKQRSAQVKPSGGDDDIMIDTEDDVPDADVVEDE